MKLTEQEINYYKSGAKGLVFTAEDAKKVDGDRLDAISAQAMTDVNKKSPKRKASDFKNAEEFKFYQLALYDAATRIQYGLS